MKPYAHHACFLAVALGFVLLPSALVAAITDADLAKVTQLIQEGKTARAKAEIVTLLDENPSDPRAPKLRKLMESLSAPAGNASGPTAEETLQWLQSHLGQLSARKDISRGDRHASSSTYTVASIAVENGVIKIVAISEIDTWSGPDMEGTYIAEHAAIPLSHVLGEIEIRTSTNIPYAVDSQTRLTFLKFQTKANSVIKTVSRYTNWRMNSQRLDGVLVSPGANDEKVIQRRVRAGLGEHSTVSVFSIPVATDEAERFKKAFDHLIKLHGGGGKELF